MARHPMPNRGRDGCGRGGRRCPCQPRLTMRAQGCCPCRLSPDTQSGVLPTNKQVNGLRGHDVSGFVSVTPDIASGGKVIRAGGKAQSQPVQPNCYQARERPLVWPGICRKFPCRRSKDALSRQNPTQRVWAKSRPAGQPGWSRSSARPAPLALPALLEKGTCMLSESERYERECSGKRRYERKRDVKQSRQYGRSRGAVGQEPYRCRYCGGWHLGHPGRTPQEAL